MRRMLPILAVASISVLISYVVPAWADEFSEFEGVPRLVPFSGHLDDGTGPVTVATTLRFEIFDEEDAGVSLWGPESHTVTPDGGDFTVMLGETVPLPATVVAGGDAYVDVTVITSAGASVSLSGRQRLGSVPYSLRASDAANGVPAGSIIPFGGTAVPDGWLLCDGQSLSSTDPEYVELFNAIGTNWGGSGGNFNVPDLRGYFLQGADSGLGRDPNATGREACRAGGATGDAVGTCQGSATRMPRNPFGTAASGVHSHALQLYPATWTQTGNPFSVRGAGPPNTSLANTTSAGSHTHPVTGGDLESRPLNASVNYIIKI
jgi:microcystin-dependent protein